MDRKENKPKRLTKNQKVMLQRRGLNPDNYVVVRESYAALWLQDIRDKSIKIVNRCN